MARVRDDLTRPAGDPGAATSGRSVSAPLLGLLQQASLTPHAIDTAIDVVAKPWAAPLLRNDHPLLQTLCRTTGVEVVTIARRHGRLLLEVDARRDDRRRWHYQEWGRRRTVLKCHAPLPHVLAAATVGRPVSAVTSSVPIASDVTIAGASVDAGRLTLTLKTVWVDY